MAKCNFSGVRISSIVSVVPTHKISIDDEDIPQRERMKKNLGLGTRHVTDSSTTTLDLCYQAALKALENDSIKKEQIDGCIMVTQTPDHFSPANANIIHGLLGLSEECIAYDINVGCSGYVYGLWMAHMLIASGSCTHVLLLAGDTIAKCTHTKDPSVTPLFGDAGTATLVQRCKSSKPAHFCLHSNGKNSNAIKINSGGFRNPFNPDKNRNANLEMDGLEVFAFSIQKGPESVRNILQYANANKDDIDAFFFHQANHYIVNNIAQRLTLPERKVPVESFTKFGNTSSASIPLAISDHRMSNPFDKQQKIILCGFGVGLSWASCLIELGDIYCPPVQLYRRG